MRVKIGTWIEREPRKDAEYTSYAADRIDVMIRPGRYDLFLTFETGYSIPMPYWLLAKLDADVVGGGYYSGFCGNNFAFTPAKLEPTKHHVQMYDYQLKELVAAGRVEVLPGFEWALKDKRAYIAEPFTWDQVKAMAVPA